MATALKELIDTIFGEKIAKSIDDTVRDSNKISRVDVYKKWKKIGKIYPEKMEKEDKKCS